MLRPTIVALALGSLACGLPDFGETFPPPPLEPAPAPELPAAEVAAPAAAAAPATSGSTVVAPSYGYRLVLPPGFPAASRDSMSVPTAIGDIVTELYTSCTLDGTCVMVNGATYPAVAFTAQDTKTMLDGARNGALANIGATLGSETELTVGGFPAREFQATASQQGITFHIRALMVVKQPHLIMVQWLGTDPSSRISPAANTFFSSLTFDAG